MDQTGGEGVDLVVEVGGAGTLGRSLKAVDLAESVAQIGVLAKMPSRLPVPLVLHKACGCRGFMLARGRILSL